MSGHKPDPYKDFEDDSERRRALGTRERWRYGAMAIVAITVCVSHGTLDTTGAIRWLLALVRSLT